MFPEWTWVVGLFVGAAIGSFLNVVIYRMPRNLSLADPPRSFCPSCNHSLGTLDLFPLLSWLLLRGKCRYCEAKIPVRYFSVEAITGGLWAAAWHQHLVVPPGEGVGLGLLAVRFVCSASVLAALVAIVYIDWEHYIIPDEINAFLLVPGVVLQFAEGTPMKALWGALLGWVMLWGTALFGRGLFGKDAMGHGDIKMMRGIGTCLGPFLVGVSYVLGILVGLVVSIALLFLLPDRAKGGNPAEAMPVEDFDAAKELKAFVLWTVVLLSVPTGVCLAIGQPAIYGLLAGAVGLLVRIIAKPKPKDGPAPESWKSLFVCGILYLFLIDVAALFFPKLNQRLTALVPDGEEEDEFEVTAQHIPFGPYLAFGAAVSLLFAQPIVSLVQGFTAGYWGMPWPP